MGGGEGHGIEGVLRTQRAKQIHKAKYSITVLKLRTD